MSSFKILYWLLATGALTLGLSPAVQALTESPGSGDGSRSAVAEDEPMLLDQRATPNGPDTPFETATENSEAPLASSQITEVVPATTVNEWVAEVTQSEAVPATTLDEWRSRIAQAQVRITNVRVEETEAGLQVVLETAGGAPRIPEPRTVGNALVSEISNATLDLPGGEDLEEFDPAEGIALVRVSSLPGNLVQVSITGSDAAPVAQLSTEGRNLVVSVEPGVATADGDDAPIQLSVTGEQGTRYAPPTARVGTRTDAALRDIPQSVQVIPRQVLEDQGVVRVGEALLNVSGVTPARDFGGSNFSFTARGFEDARILRNGTLSGEEDQSTVTVPSTVERIEVLKGPASVLYGRAEPGGLINIITKQPESEPSYEIQLRAGSFDFLEPSIDFTGPLSPDGKLTYRLNVAYLKDGLSRDQVEAELFSIAPVIRYEFSEGTDLTLEYEYAEDRRTFDDGIPVAAGFDPFDVSGDLFLGEPDNFFNDSFHRFYLTLNYRFNEDLRLRSIVGGEFEDSAINAFRSFGSFDEDTGNLERTLFQTSEFSNSNFSWQTELVADFETGSIKHQLVAGFDLTFSNFTIDPGENTNGNFPINIFDPDYDQEFPPSRPSNIFLDFDTEENSYSVFLQDLITLTPNLKLLVGGRYDFINTRSDRFFAVFDENGELQRESDTISEIDDGAFSPRVGIVYQPTDAISLYGSFSRSFVPNSVNTFEGEEIEPERGTQYEIGARVELGDISINLAAYDLTKTNIAVADPDNIGFSLAIGEVNSRGIELDIAGEILDGWNIIASGFINETEIMEGDDRFPEGDRLNQAPLSGASLWTTYRIQKGSLEGLGFGAGVFFVGETEAQLPNDTVVPSYTRFDATILGASHLCTEWCRKLKSAIEIGTA
ncbi:MAG: TonB-dependent siderophore receptor [Cyanophyceae cyanobacterium]